MSIILFYATQHKDEMSDSCVSPDPEPAHRSVRPPFPVKPVSRRWVNAAPIRGEVMPAAVRFSEVKPATLRRSLKHASLSAVKPVGSSPRAHGYGATPRVLSAHPHSKATPPGPAPPVPSPPVPALPGPIPQVPAPPERPPEFLILPKKYFFWGAI